MNTVARRYIVSAPDLPAAPAPISQAVVVGPHCYVSGQLATDTQGTFRAGTVQDEGKLAFRNVFAALRGAGFTPDDLVFIDIALTDLSDLPEVNVLYAELFAEGRRPARTVAQVAALPYGGRIKIAAVALRDA